MEWPNKGSSMVSCLIDKTYLYINATDMDRVLDKELVNQLLKLEVGQQEKVLVFIKELLATDELNNRADISEQAIIEGKTKRFEEFNEGFEEWKSRKRASMK